MTLTLRTPDNNCWSCGHQFSAASDFVTNKPPSPGDVSVCIACAAPGIFRSDLTVGKPSPEEMEELLADPGYIQYATVIREMHEMRGHDH